MITGSGPCVSFKRELLEALHNFGSHRFMMALYTDAANINVDDTTAYVTAGEASGVGYVAGGAVLNNVQVLGPQSRASYVTWDDPVWSGSTITARAALIYNQTAQQRAVAVLDFGADKSSNNGDFRVKLPPPSPTTALIRLL
jgi:hypothetical protein